MTASNPTDPTATDADPTRIDPYDALPYDNFPFRPTHPDVVGTIAGLMGLNPAPFTQCRVLELGCGMGGNLLSMAISAPRSRFVGVDLSARQIAFAQDEAFAVGARNVEYAVADILSLNQANGPGLGQFDYIICHGVWSWVPPAVQEKIFALMQDLLAPQGVGFISYNVLPGWHFRGAIRSMVQRVTPAEATPQQRAAVARSFLAEVAAHTPAQRSAAAALLKSEIKGIEPLSDSYLFHEHLAEYNTPIWFTDFIGHLETHDLQYVGDAEFATMLPDRLGPESAAAARQHGQGEMVRLESWLDMVTARFFRRSLICRADCTLDRNLNPACIAGHWINTALTANADEIDLSPGVEASFTAPSGLVISTAEPLLKAALRVLDEARPRGVVLEELAEQAAAYLERPVTPEDVDRLGANALELFAQGYAEICREAPRFALTAGRRPRTTALIRRQAASDRDGVFNLRHQSIAVDALDRALLAQLDGTRDRKALIVLVGA
ncbi:MAG: SAM-dependent methyltransferase/methyltransferase-like protein, partial [Bradymonadia bacterium]